MDGFLRKHAYRLAGLAFALVALASLLTFHAQDPTLTNLRYPKDGVGNWMGYPGALVGGTVVEGFGLAALLLPLLIANLFLTSRNRPGLHRYALHSAVLMLAAATSLGLGAGDPVLGLRGPGLVGWTSGQWVLATTGRWPGAALIAAAALYALAHVVYAPQLRRAFTDGRTLLRFGLRQALGRLRAAWHGWRPQTGWAWHELPLLPVHALMFALAWLWEHGVRRTLIRPLSVAAQGWRERRYSVARVKSGPALPLAQPAMPAQEPVAHYRPPVDIPMPDGFDQWLERPEPARPASVAPAPAPPVRPAPPAMRSPDTAAPQVQPPPRSLPPLPAESGAATGGERVARWEEYLRRYQENLDLDWDERSWKRKRLEDLAQDRDEVEGESAAPRPLK